MSYLTMAEMQGLKTDKYTAETEALAYYDATRKPQYLTRRLQKFFNNAPHYKQNWMSTIVDAVRNKLIIDSFQIGDVLENEEGIEQRDPREESFNECWRTDQMNIEADSVHEFCHAVGEAFIISGQDSGGNAVAYAVDPRAVVAYYGGADPREITQAVYFWLDGEMNMATSWMVTDTGAVEQQEWAGKKRTSNTTTPADESKLTYTESGDAILTGCNRIPVFHFRRSNRNIEPEFYQVQDIQDMINKAFVAQGFTMENAADIVRYVITAGDVEEVSQMGSGDTIAIPPAPQNTQPVSVGKFDTGDPDQFANIISQNINACASISATPRHYFGGGQGAQISGEALQALESPLVAKVRRYQRRHAPQWEALAAFMLTVEGAETMTAEVNCIYADPRTTLTQAEAVARNTNVQAGIPIITQLRREGWSQQQIDQLLEDRGTETPVTLDDKALEQVYSKMEATTTGIIEPILEQSISLIADAALKESVKRVKEIRV